MYKSSFRVKNVRYAAAALLAAAISTPASLRGQSPVPVLIPYTTTVVAGNPQSVTGGYSGDGGKALGTTLNAPGAVAVDSVGNIYISDSSNAVIREVNAQTGVISIIAGIAPSKCTATLCTANPGYADGVPATSTGVGSSIGGLAVDGYGNLFYADKNQQAVRVLYKGGTQVANLIALEDPTAAPTASAVVPGNIYTIAGAPTAPTKGTTGATDNVLASAALFHNPGQISLDPAGNIYVQDVANGTSRVINAQASAQVFFGATVQPGFIKAIVGCSAVQTVKCTTNGTGGPPAAALVGSALAGQAVDKYGNLYTQDTKGSDPIYIGAAFNQGAALSHLIFLENGVVPATNTFWSVFNADPNNTTAPTTTSVVGTSLANKYNSSSGLVIRPSSVTVDSLGNIYYLDNHWPALFRVDVNSQVAVRMSATSATTGTASLPVPCSSTVPTLTNDTYGDGCPVALARLSGFGQMTTDGDGNVYVADSSEFLIRKLSVNNRFPATPVGTAVTQTLQVRFDGSNLPVTSTATTTSPLQIQSGNSDFSILTAPTCSNTTLGLDASIDCIVVVTFNPSQPGLRTGSLQASTKNGAVYTFALSGTGNGAALAIDGGTQTVVSTTGLGKATSIAIDAVGNQFIADTTNDRIVVVTAGGTKQSVLGSGFKAPQQVAVDAAGNVYVADTGNNRVVEVPAGTVFAATPTITELATGLSKPQGVAVDSLGNVYIADTGNVRILEIPYDGEQAPATLLQFNAGSASNGLKNPVSLATDGLGNLYIADPSAKSVFVLPPGGGDLQTVYGPTTPLPAVGSNLKTPDGVAVDGAGDVYISDSTLNAVVEKPSSTGPGSEQFTLSFTGLNAPGGLALDPQGNLYLADTGNSRILMMNRHNPTVNFGSLGVFQPALTAPLTIGNIGNKPVPLPNPATVITGTGTANFSLQDKANENCGGTSLLPGLTCTLNASFLPLARGATSETVSVTGTGGGAGVSALLSGVGVSPLGAVAVAFSQAPVTGGTTAAVTATVTQPHGPNTPTGTVTFVYTVNEGDTTRGGSTNTVTVPLVPGTGGAATATLSLTGLLPARRYSVVATYNGDAQDSPNTAAPFLFVVPGGITLSVVANSVTFAYGQPVPAITGTVTGILPADSAGMTTQFTTPATSTTPVGTYPITLVLSGGNYLNYVVPPAVTSTGAPAIVTETPAPLTVTAVNATTVYGSQNLTYKAVITGALPNDPFTVSFTPPKSGILDVGTYVLVPILAGPVANYKVTVVNGTLIVTQAASSVTVLANNKSVLPTNLPSEQIAISVQSSTSGTPTGTVTITDTFTPLNASTANPPVTIGPLNLVNGAAIYSPTSPVFGTHRYTVAYSGDLNFQTSTSSSAVVVVVDNPDFFLTTPSSPLLVVPGVIPGGNQSIPGESAATPETAVITISPILGYTGTVTLTCASPSSYVTCSLSPSSVLLSTATPQTSILSVSTPATLPVDFKGALQVPRGPGTLAFLPLGLLAMIPFARARRSKLTRFMWLMLMCVAMGVGLTGCTTTNLVKFFTPVPEGEQPLTITATDGISTKTLVVTINIQ